MFDLASAFTEFGADVFGPLPAWLVGGAADGEAADVDEFEASFDELPHFIGRGEAFEDDIRFDHLDDPFTKQWGWGSVGCVLRICCGGWRTSRPPTEEFFVLSALRPSSPCVTITGLDGFARHRPLTLTRGGAAW